MPAQALPRRAAKKNERKGFLWTLDFGLWTSLNRQPHAELAERAERKKKWISSGRWTLDSGLESSRWTLDFGRRLIPPCISQPGAVKLFRLLGAFLAWARIFGGTILRLRTKAAAQHPSYETALWRVVFC